MPSPVSVYRIFRRGHGEAAAVRPVVIALVLLALALTIAGVTRVKRQHEVLRLGYELSRTSEHVRKLRETRRQLELELATLSSPERIRMLATALGMAPVAPDRIRVIGRRSPASAGELHFGRREVANHARATEQRTTIARGMDRR